jgi:olefin beta-lactone synthetase
VNGGAAAPAQLPPADIVGLDPAWSRLVTAPDHHGEWRTWHLLDNQVADARLTLLCVHGNPSWSFLWRSLLQQAPEGVRVIAVDQLEMGFSERSGLVRRLADRIADLTALTDHLELTGPVATVAHDWGGPISLGWAQAERRRHPDRVRGVVLMNTAVHQPEGSPAPTLIRAARAKGVLRPVTVATSTFLRGAFEMSRPRLAPEVRDGFMAPYRTAERRQAIAAFVQDIPLDSSHPSHATLAEVANGLDDFGDVPALLVWGPSDQVFSDRYLHDLEARLPHAQVHRVVGASHFLQEEADIAAVVYDWLTTLDQPAGETAALTPRPPLWDRLDKMADVGRPAVVEISQGGRSSITFSDLHRRVGALAAGLIGAGIKPGDRVALMIPPGIDLTVVLYACWRMGAVIVLVDSGLGPRNMGRALASAAPDHLIGISRAMVAGKVLRWPGRRILAGDMSEARRRALGVDVTVAELEAAGSGRDLPDAPGDDDLAAIVFTSGSTGPSKGVAYRHHQVQAQRDLLTELYSITSEDRLVAAFAPFALYGPALGITSVVPDMDVTSPATLSAAALGEAVAAIQATMVFASPAALRNVVDTAAQLTPAHRGALEEVRVLMSAGAPVNPGLLAAAQALMPGAEAHTPYGMTEVLPVADITLTELTAKGVGDGVCVGRPRAGVTVRISALDEVGRAVGALSAEPNTVGEVVIAAAHRKDHYVRLWHTEHLSASNPPGWHRSGDVGWIDDDGYLWIGGRLAHVITTATGPVTPVAFELAAEAVPGVARAAAVGVGPVGAQVPVIVLETGDSSRRVLAEARIASSVRAEAARISPLDIAAVLQVEALPVDRRHNSKIDRAAVAEWASAVLAGNKVGGL